MVHLQGPAEYLNILRDLREIGRQQVERSGPDRGMGASLKGPTDAQTDLLRSIDREQVRHHGHD